MKRIIFTAAILLLGGKIFAQADTTKPKESDTVNVGGFIIIKKEKPKENYDSSKTSRYSVDITIGNDSYDYDGKSHGSLITTNWLIFDLGFANWRDKTVYGSKEANSYLHANGGPDFTSSDLAIATKSSNVNIW